MRRITLFIACVCLATLGCGWLNRGPHQGLGHHRRPRMMLENPLMLPPMDQEFMWREIVDTVDDYFKIEREDRIRVVGGVPTEGRIETFPEIGASYLEPWRRDSTPGIERLHSTLQSVRRRAILVVSPGPSGYLVNVVVLKELEDVAQPAQATVGSSTLRHDGTIVRTRPGGALHPTTLGWIPQGRDLSLEQQILIELQSRLVDAGVMSPQATMPIIPPTPSTAPPSQLPAPPPIPRSIPAPSATPLPPPPTRIP